MHKNHSSWAVILLIVGLALAIFGILQIQDYINFIKLLAILSLFVPGLQLIVILMIFLQNTYGFYMVYAGLGAIAIGTIIGLTD